MYGKNLYVNFLGETSPRHRPIVPCGTVGRMKVRPRFIHNGFTTHLRIIFYRKCLQKNEYQEVC